MILGTAVAGALVLSGCRWWSLMAIPLFFWCYGLEWLLGMICFRDSRKAYRNISFEQEAYSNELDDDYLKSRKPFAWIQYIRLK